jgi:serine protease Do
MKRILGLLFVAVAGGVMAVGAYKLIEKEPATQIIQQLLPAQPVRYVNIPSSANPSLDFTYAAQETVNSVVHVKTESTVNPAYNNPWLDFFGQQNGPHVQRGSGSGVIISSDGYIVTNNHVVDGAEKIMISLNNNKNYEGVVIGTDPATDIALVKIDERNLPFVEFGDSDELLIGEWVLAVGNPFDLTSTVTAGIVSAKARNINLLRPDYNRDIFPVESFIQTDAAVNPGNSGGALVNIKGELVGINTAIASKTGSYSGYSFAVPSTIVKKVADDIKEYGMVQRAFIGVRINDINEGMADELGLDEVAGVFVADVVEDGAAAAAGITGGDVILSVGARSVKNVTELQEEISRYRPGDDISLKIWRDGKMKNLEITLRNKDGNTDLREASVESIEGYLGAYLTAPTKAEMSALKLNSGVKVFELGDGKLKDSGVRSGFIITKVDGERVSDPESLKQLLSQKTGGILLEGYYSNGKKAYYGFGS